jgi:hypothetical protein
VETDLEDKSDAKITAVMREATKAKVASFRGKFSKYTALANPRLGDQFLEEVQGLIRLWQPNPIHPLIFFSNNISDYQALEPKYETRDDPG